MNFVALSLLTPAVLGANSSACTRVGACTTSISFRDPHNVCAAEHMPMSFPFSEKRAATPYRCHRRLRMCFLDWAVDGRGMPASTFSYASHSESVLGHEVVILVGSIDPCKAGGCTRRDLRTDRTLEIGSYSASCLQRWCKHFPVRFFKGLEELGPAAIDAGCDATYIQINSAAPHRAVRALQAAGKKVIVHCMGWCKHRQGDSYAVISDWASATFRTGPVVVYPVSECPLRVPAAALALRATHGVPEAAPLLCYFGGPDSFSLNWVVKGLFGSTSIVDGWLKDFPQLHLMFMPPNKAVPPHARIHVNPGSTQPEAKAAYLHACDAMLHARGNGESFGMAVAEFSVCNKPVITQGRGGTSYETAHLDNLGAKAWTYQYNNKASFLDQVRRLVDTPRAAVQQKNWNAFENKKPSTLMRESFHSKFIEPLGLCKKP